jgi:Tfp pilus assembly protein PilN
MLKTLVRIGFARGLGGSRGWLTLGVVAGGLRLLRRIAKREEDVVYLEKLLPGQSLVIQHIPRER